MIDVKYNNMLHIIYAIMLYTKKIKNREEFLHLDDKH